MANDTYPKILDTAINFIHQREKDDDYICEQMPPEYCENHCIDTLRKECVVYFLKNVYEKVK